MRNLAANRITGLVGALLGFSLLCAAQTPAIPPHPPAAQTASPNIRPLGASPMPAGLLPPGILAFDSESKEFTSLPGATKLDFSFYLTNISPAAVVVTDVRGSCFCTVAKLPVTLPWTVAPGNGGPLPFVLDLAGKSGTLFKTVTVTTDQGLKALSVKVTIPPAPPAPMTGGTREKNQELMKVDPQSIFKGDCTKCHVEPVIGKYGKDLYTAACGICHEAEHRATMVPDLHNLPNDTNAEYWKLLVTQGKPNSLMPAFSQAQGGPLSDMQITSLVDYLVATLPAQGTNSRPPVAAPAKP